MFEFDRLSPTELSLLGTAASSVVAALSYWAKTLHERRRATRAALYYLLELHHLVRRLLTTQKDLPTQLVAAARTVIAERGGTLSDTEAGEVQAAVAPMMRDFGRNQMESLAVDIKQPFAKCLTDLARENPVLAFKLRGRDRLMTICEQVESLLAAQPVAEGTSTSNSGKSPSFDAILLELTVAELEHFVRQTAWGCDLITHAKVWLLLRRASRIERDELRTLAEDLVRRLLFPSQPSTSAQ